MSKVLFLITLFIFNAKTTLASGCNPDMFSSYEVVAEQAVVDFGSLSVESIENLTKTFHKVYGWNNEETYSFPPGVENVHTQIVESVLGHISSECSDWHGILVVKRLRFQIDKRSFYYPELSGTYVDQLSENLFVKFVDFWWI